MLSLLYLDDCKTTRERQLDTQIYTAPAHTNYREQISTKTEWVIYKNKNRMFEKKGEKNEGKFEWEKNSGSRGTTIIFFFLLLFFGFAWKIRYKSAGTWLIFSCLQRLSFFWEIRRAWKKRRINWLNLIKHFFRYVYALGRIWRLADKSMEKEKKNCCLPVYKVKLDISVFDAVVW